MPTARRSARASAPAFSRIEQTFGEELTRLGLAAELGVDLYPRPLCRHWRQRSRCGGYVVLVGGPSHRCARAVLDVGARSLGRVRAMCITGCRRRA